MRGLRKVFLSLLLALLLPFPAWAAGGDTAPARPVPILLYHRFGPTIADSMTVTTTDFAASLEYLRSQGYHVIPLRELVDYQLGRGPAPPPHSLVITIDDGHRSVYSEAWPLIRKYQVPVTLFIYPSAISNASYAMTWAQLREMRQSGLVDCQSHTFWHPNFKKEKNKLAPAEYDKLVETQLQRPREKLEKELGAKIDLLAWPFGIHDEALADKAAAAGYRAAFTMERRPAGAQENIMAQPRYLISGARADRQLKSILAAGN